VTSKELIDRLPILDENIFAEAAGMAGLFMEAARFRVQAMRRRSAAVLARDQHMANISLRIRAIRDARGTKTTESYIEHKVEIQPKTMELRSEVEKAFALEEFAKLLLRAYAMRKDAIEIIAQAQIYEGGREVALEEKQEQRKRLSKQARRLDNLRHSIEDGDGEDANE
jgi:hypothetical protein